MQKLVRGIHEFQNYVFRDKSDLFKSLANGQKPMALFVTCSDSRIDPHLLTQTDPGDIFVLRNAGNIIPAAPHVGGEAATIEFAVQKLGIRDIVVCGHSNCGAMSGLLNPAAVEGEMPAVKQWLGHAERTADIMRTEYTHLSDRALQTATAEENVIVQIENLRTHSFIEERLARGELKLHGWMYKIETGEVFTFDPGQGQFIGLHQEEPTPIYPRNDLAATSVAIQR